MTVEQLADRFQLEGTTREAFLAKLRGIQRLWSGLKEAQYPDNKLLNRQLDQYRDAVEKALRIARMLPEYLIDIEPDPNASNDSARNAWTQHPPHPIDYLEYLLWDRTDWPETIAARQSDPDAVVYKSNADLLPRMPKTETHKRDVLLNNLIDLFVIAYPKAELKLYRSEHERGYSGGFYAFLSDVLQLVDPDSDLLQTLSERFIKRSQ